jgi:hypothetical protein
MKIREIEKERRNILKKKKYENLTGTPPPFPLSLDAGE